MNVLFVGRFQPFHKKHFEIIDEIHQAKNVNLIIGIAAAQYSHTKRNPFTYSEREQMIKIVLDRDGINARIVPLPDINDKDMWVDYVIKVLDNKLDLVISNNVETQMLFKKQDILCLGININKDGLSGTFVRDAIAERTNLWELAVDPDVIEYMKKIDGIRRIRKTYLDGDKNE